MRLVKIKNKYLFKSDNPEGIHYYAVYYDSKNKRNNAVALTHIYKLEDKRDKQIRKGNIIIEKFNELSLPSGVQNYYYSKNINGNNLNLKDSEITYISKRYLSKSQSNRIKKFAKYNRNKKNS